MENNVESRQLSYYFRKSSCGAKIWRRNHLSTLARAFFQRGRGQGEGTSLEASWCSRPGAEHPHPNPLLRGEDARERAETSESTIGLQVKRALKVERRSRAVVAIAVAVALAAPSVLAQHVHQPAATPSSAAAPTPSGEPKILYWYDPMHPQYRSDKPGTAPDCGMDLAPKYADEEATQQKLPVGTVEISPLKQQLIGVRTAPVTRRVLEQDIRTVGIIRPDESRVRKVHTKFPGWVEQLFVSYTGQAVRAGDPMLSIYSPDLVSTQTEYLLARRGDQQLHQSPFPEAATGAKALLDAARRRLLLWDITPQQIRELEETGKPRTALTLHSPVSGFVTVKDVYQGLYVTPDTELYTVVDLSRVWVLLDIYENEMPSVHLGMPVTLQLRSQPGESITGTITYIYPYLDNQTRTNKMRVEFDNPGLRFKPDMYATGEIHALLGEHLVVPQDAVLDSGMRQVVFVALGDGFFAPREVRLGERGDDYAEVLEGLREGEQVVVGANFMVDSESQLKAALSAMGGMPGMPGMKMDQPGVRSRESGDRR